MSNEDEFNDGQEELEGEVEGVEEEEEEEEEDFETMVPTDEEDDEEDDNDNDDDDDDDDVNEFINNTLVNKNINEENSDSDSESEEDEEEYEKIDEEYKLKYIKEQHPEIINDNYDVIIDKTKITRDKDNIIIDENHKTIPILTKYEKAKILGLRIAQLNKGSKPFVNIRSAKVIDTYLIAEKELEQKKLPFIIMRPFPNGKKEYWKLEDLEYIEH